MEKTDLGTLARQGDRWTLTFTRKLAHPREKVWRAVTEPEHLAVWYPQEIVGERKAGAPLRFVTPGDGGDGFDGQMLWLGHGPPHLLARVGQLAGEGERPPVTLAGQGAETSFVHVRFSSLVHVIEVSFQRVEPAVPGRPVRRQPLIHLP